MSFRTVLRLGSVEVLLVPGRTPPSGDKRGGYGCTFLVAGGMNPVIKCELSAPSSKS